MSVMYTTPSGDSNRNNRNYRSTQETTVDVEGVTGFFSFVAICISTYFVFQVLSVLLSAMGTVGVVVLVVISVVSMAVSVIWLFKVLDEGVGVLFVPLIGFGLSFFIAGLPSFLAVVSVVFSVCVVIYLIATTVVQSKSFAIAITIVPVVGASFFVPITLSKAGLVAGLMGGTVTSQVSSQLIAMQNAFGQQFSTSAVVSYQIRNNRLYADIARDGSVHSIELDTAELTRTRIRWLEHNLSDKMNTLLGSGATAPNPQITQLLSPVANTLKSHDAVLVAEGALENFPHQTVLGVQNVFRASSLNDKMLSQNLVEWTRSSVLRPQRVSIVNALPQSATELENLGLQGASWQSWNGLHTKFAEASREAIATPSNTSKAAVLNALKEKDCVLFLIAHCDGVSIRLPNGESVHVNDLDDIADAIRANSPTVFLFSCETARTGDVRSFAKALLDHGAQAVVAPVTLVSTTEAFEVFSSFVRNALGENPLPIHQAFHQALEETGRTLMEVWLAVTPSSKPVVPENLSDQSAVVQTRRDFPVEDLFGTDAA